MKLEICSGNIATVQAAGQFGIHRIELCAALELGGLTPSYGLIERSVGLNACEIHVMIRPRPGNFVYDDSSIQVMKQDIKITKELGAHGVVFGCLTVSNQLNHKQVSDLIHLAKSLQLEVTFHRAFDFIQNPMEALNYLIEEGADRILTSGQAKTALEGRECIQQLVKHSLGRIEIMAGSGVHANNAQTLIKTGVDALHFSADKNIHSTDNFGMGHHQETDLAKIASICNTL